MVIMTDEEENKKIKANKPLFLERYFGYDADIWRAKLLKKIDTREKLRKAGLED